MAISGPSMFTEHCSVHLVTITTGLHVVTITLGFSYSNRSLLKKWHLLHLICAIYVVTMKTDVYFVKPLLKKWHFSDLVCSGHVVIITTGFTKVT